MTTAPPASGDQPTTFATPSSIPRSSSKRSLQLDFLRGVAILLVLATHLQVHPPDDSFIAPLFAFFHEIGWVGVDLFFVLSGFLVGGLLINELDRHGRIDAKRFLIRRGLKIYPLYYVFLGYFFAMPLARAAMGRGSVSETFHDLWASLWPNLLFLNGYIGDNPLGHTWTLAVEEHFYLILPFFLILASRHLSIKKLTVLCAAFLVPVTIYRTYVVYHPDILVDPVKETHLRIDSLFAGVAIRGLADAWPRAFTAIGRFRYALIPVGALLISVVPYFPNQLKLSLGYTLTTVGASAVLIGAFHVRSTDISVLKKTAEWTVFAVCWIGTYSYSIYVWHVTLFRVIERQILKLGYSPTSPGAVFVWFGAAIAIAALTIFVSALISRVVEIPVLKFRDRFFPSRSRSVPTSAEGAAS